jgi:S1-C subfamily serine protease
VTIRAADRQFGPGATGALVAGVEDGGPAESAGIGVGDRIIAIGGTEVATPSDLTDVLAAKRAGATATVTWVDGSGREHDARIRLARAPIA